MESKFVNTNNYIISNITYSTKDILVKTLREEFKNIEAFKLVEDKEGYIDIEKTGIVISDYFYYDQKFLPVILVKSISGPEKPISFNQEAGAIQYAWYADENNRLVRKPISRIYAGAMDLTINISIAAEDTLTRETLTDIVFLTLMNKYRNKLIQEGVFVKTITLGGETEEKYSTDYIFFSSLDIQVRTEWRREVPDFNTLESININPHIGIRDFPLESKLMSRPPSFLAIKPGDHKIELWWDKPASSNFCKFVLIANQEHFPTHPLDGDLVYEGIDTHIAHLNLANEITMYYTLFSVSNEGIYSRVVPQSQVFGVPCADAFLYDFSQVVAIPENDTITLNWNNPTDPGYESTLIKQSISGFPFNHTQGKTVYEGNGHTVKLTGLNNSLMYYFSFFSKDKDGNYSDLSINGKIAAKPSSLPVVRPPAYVIPQNQGLIVKWTNLSGYGAHVVYKIRNFPRHPYDGLPVYRGFDSEEVEISNLLNDVEYYFSIFLIDRTGVILVDNCTNVIGLPSNRAPQSYYASIAITQVQDTADLGVGYDPTVHVLFVYVDGILMDSSVYTVIDNQTIQFNQPLQPGNILVIYWTPL